MMRYAKIMQFQSHQLSVYPDFIFTLRFQILKPEGMKLAFYMVVYKVIAKLSHNAFRSQHIRTQGGDETNGMFCNLLICKECNL